MSNGDAYEYGQLLGRMQLGMQRMVADINRGFADALAAGHSRRPATLEEWEARRVAAYRARVAAERRSAEQHLRQAAARLRREVGLR